MSSLKPPVRLFCFGLGFSAAGLTRHGRGAGWHIAGTTRSVEKCRALRAAEVDAHLFDDGRPLDAAGLAALADARFALISVPPGDTGDLVLAQHGDALARHGTLTWLGYLSTTGVYGDHGGGWVDETTPLAPTGPRQAARAEAERAWLDLGAAKGIPVHIFRLAGIYGPGRSALDTVRAGRARRIDKPGQVFSRIHVDDIAQCLAASMARPNPGAIYNLCDDEPAPGHAVIAHACELLGTTPPPLVPIAEAALSPMAASFYADNKRVRNTRMKRDLGIVLRHPTYRDGLAAQLAFERGP